MLYTVLIARFDVNPNKRRLLLLSLLVKFCHDDACEQVFTQLIHLYISLRLLRNITNMLMLREKYCVAQTHRQFSLGCSVFADMK